MKNIIGDAIAFVFLVSLAAIPVLFIFMIWHDAPYSHGYMLLMKILFTDIMVMACSFAASLFIIESDEK